MNTKKLIDRHLKDVPDNAYGWHTLITTVDIDDQSGRVLEIGWECPINGGSDLGVG